MNYVAGKLSENTGNVTLAWSIVFSILAALFFFLFVYHRFVLPLPATDQPALKDFDVTKGFLESFGTFFQRPDIWRVLAFLMLFRFGEAQALKLVTPFLLDPVAKGGLGLGTSDVGLVYGIVGAIALTVGGLLGGFVISRQGLRHWLWPMLLSVHLPNIAFVYLAFALPQNIYLVATAIAVEQFGYGFGFAAYLLFMIMVAGSGVDGGKHKTAHYAICTGFMALGMMLPGMASGWIQAQLGYQSFFIWVCIATLPSLVATAFIRVDPQFGRKTEGAA